MWGTIMQPLTVTIPEAVRLTGISRSRLYVAMKNGDIAALKAGRRTLIPFADLEAYMNSLPVAYGED